VEVLMESLAMRLNLPHRERLTQVLTVLEREPISLNMATFFAHRRGEDTKMSLNRTGCAIGHYVWIAEPKHLKLVPLNFLEQLKAPIAAKTIWQAYPNKDWRHYTLHYSGPDIEAWGLSAAVLFFQIKAYDVQRLFYPNATNYILTPEPELVASRLRRFIETERAMAADA
jgi:hypothetical protein